MIYQRKSSNFNPIATCEQLPRNCLSKMWFVIHLL